MGPVKFSKLLVVVLCINFFVGILNSYGAQNTAEDYVNQGKLFYKNNNYDKAIDSYNKAIKLNNKLVMAYINRGIAYIRINKFDLAIADFSKTIKLDPNNGKAYNNRAIAYWYKGDHKKAREDINKAQSLGIAITEEKLKAVMPLP